MVNTRFSISTWSLHGLISGGVPLLEIPAQVAAHGINSLEICHFHFPSTEPVFITGLKKELSRCGVHLSTLLIDTGDVTVADEEARSANIDVIKSWIDVASHSGATRVRVSAGQEPPTPAAIARSAGGLRDLFDFAAGREVALITENWQLTGMMPRALLAIIDESGRDIGLCADTGNAEGQEKYETLQLLFPRATSIHFKARTTTDGQLDFADIDRCLALMQAANYVGPITLIYGETINEWHGVDELKAAIISSFS